MARLNRTQVIEGVVAGQMKAANELPKFSVGDTIDVHYKIIEGDKERGEFVLLVARGNETAVLRVKLK